MLQAGPSSIQLNAAQLDTLHSAAERQNNKSYCLVLPKANLEVGGRGGQGG